MTFRNSELGDTIEFAFIIKLVELHDYTTCTLQPSKIADTVKLFMLIY